MYKPGDLDKNGRIVQEDGTVIIPGSRRPDGTMRKDLRVKPDYIPPDEAAKWESKGTRIMRQRKEAGIPGLGPVQAPEPKLSKNQKKNIRKKEQKAERHQYEDELADRLAGTHVSHDNTPDWVPGKPPATAKADPAKPAASEPEPAADEADPAVALAKKIKNLSKKIRLAEDLQAKVDAGEVAPSAEQADKLARLEGMRQELAELELQRAQS